MNDGLPRLLAARLAEPLPGPMVGSRFESRPRHGWRYDRAPPGARLAAVLLLLYRVDGRWHVPLTLRPENMADHAGQVSLPGGAVEPGESSPQAAVREFHEELGPRPVRIELLGHLSPLYVGASNFLVTPWVGATAERPALVANPLEAGALAGPGQLRLPPARVARPPLHRPPLSLAEPPHLGRHLHDPRRVGDAAGGAGDPGVSEGVRELASCGREAALANPRTPSSKQRATASRWPAAVGSRGFYRSCRPGARLALPEASENAMV
jgi:8-oxo-dGTP pyrophosphatase MutT (NUDIX family)